MPCPLRAVGATARRWHKLRVPLVERGEFEDEQDVRLNPELEIADGEQDAFRLLPSRAPIFFEASGKRLFLLVGLELLSNRHPSRALRHQKARRRGLV